MAEYAQLLLLRLEGPLQSWGEWDKWDFRDSASMPSKSGIVGLLACAMGLERTDPEIARLSQAIKVAVRADRPGIRTEDFQTVTGSPLRNADGKRRSTGDTAISRRCYLQDASFLVVIQSDDTWICRIVSALQHPKWCVYLGRKSCVPSRPVLEAVTTNYRDMMEALRCWPLAPSAFFPVSYECEWNQEHCVSYMRPDRRVEGDREFVQRRVWHGVIKEADHVSE